MEIKGDIQRWEDDFIYINGTLETKSRDDIFELYTLKTLFQSEFTLVEEEPEEIDIANIEELGNYCNIIEHTENEKVLFRMMRNNANKIDELIKAVKQLDKKLNSN